MGNTVKKEKKKVPSFIEKVHYNNKTVEKVNAVLLADWMKQNVPYRLAMDENNQAMFTFLYEGGVYKEVNERLFKAMIKQQIVDYNLKLVSMSVVKEAYEIIVSDLEYTPLDDFNKDENIINFQNGILHLDSMTLMPHSPEYLSTIQLPCDWTECEEETPVFDEFLNRLTNEDAEVQHLLLEFVGLCVSNVSGAHLKKALFLYGPGNTGKSQLLSLTQDLLGNKNYFSIDLKTIEARFGTSYIYGKRLVGTADMSFMSVAELCTFKRLTGGDNVMAERKGQQGFCYQYQGLLWFATNSLPHFSCDRNNHTYERFVIVPCNNVVPEAEQDPNLEKKMFAERRGIVYKAVMALKAFIDNGRKIKEPQVVINARQEFKRANNPVGAFFEECMIPVLGKQSGQVTVTAVHEAFVKWCKGNNNNHSISNKDFQRELANYLDVDVSSLTKRISDGVVYTDYTLSDTAKAFYL